MFLTEPSNGTGNSVPLAYAFRKQVSLNRVRHNFIAYRDDRLGQSPSITFEGNAWLSYVPLRLPWTLCIRDRVPRGSVAVLLNGAHTWEYDQIVLDATGSQGVSAAGKPGE
jgi:hypothetical protein